MLYYKKILFQNRQFAKTRVSLKTVPPSFFGKVPGFQNDPAMESFEIKFFYNTTLGTAKAQKHLQITTQSNPTLILHQILTIILLPVLYSYSFYQVNTLLNKLLIFQKSLPPSPQIHQKSLQFVQEKIIDVSHQLLHI